MVFRLAVLSSTFIGQIKLVLFLLDTTVSYYLEYGYYGYQSR